MSRGKTFRAFVWWETHEESADAAVKGWRYALRGKLALLNLLKVVPNKQSADQSTNLIPNASSTNTFLVNSCYWLT